jgi:hypothetical protein
MPIMTTIQTKSHVGPDGLLRLTLPVGLKDADLDVTVIVRTTTETPKTFANQEEWLRFIDETAGQWQGEPLQRPSQGEFERREEWG